MGVAVEAQPSTRAKPADLSGSGTRGPIEERDEAIQACYDLLSSGRPLAEIFVAMKALGPLNKNQLQPRDVPYDTQGRDLLGEPRSHPWAIYDAVPLVEANLSLIPFKVSQPHLLSPVSDKHSHKNSHRAIRAALFWFVPAMSLMLVAVAGKLLIDAVLTQNHQTQSPGTETIASRPLISELANLAPQQPATARASEAVAAEMSPTTPAVVTRSFVVQHDHSLDDGKSVRESASPKILSPPANRARSTQSRHLQSDNSSPKRWVLPRRLTDGF